MISLQNAQHKFLSSLWLEGPEERNYAGAFAPTFGCDRIWKVTAFESLCLHFEVHLRIDVRGVQGNVPKPGADGIDIDA